MKKILYTLLILCFIPVFGADKIHVQAMTDFSTLNPSDSFKVKIVEDGQMDSIFVVAGDILNCTVEKITDPTRAKRDAKVYFNIISYEDNKGVHEINPLLSAKYAKTVLNKEEIKKTPPKKVVKKTASTVGSFFVKGFSYGVSFVDGVAENQEGNRLKSGVKQVYDDSFLSLIEEGNEITINDGDTFWFIVKSKKDDDPEEE